MKIEKGDMVEMHSLPYIMNIAGMYGYIVCCKERLRKTLSDAGIPDTTIGAIEAHFLDDNKTTILVPPSEFKGREDSTGHLWSIWIHGDMFNAFGSTSEFVEYTGGYEKTFQIKDTVYHYPIWAVKSVNGKPFKEG